MKRVGILTLYFKTYNFGAQLQSYALQRTIEELGYQCEQIRFVWSNEQTVENYDNASISQLEFARFSNFIKHSAKIYDVSNIHEALECYDAFVVGSDQIWGVENSMPLIKLPIMTLSFVPDSKNKIAYAASFGSTSPSSKIEEVLKNELLAFDEISMREGTAAEYISGLLNRKVDTVLDPVFLRSRDEWDELSKGEGDKVEPYIFYYTAGADSIQDEIVDGVSKVFGCEVKRLGYINGEHIGPEKFIAWIKNAKYVVTDSFHASVLCVLFHKQFVTLPVDSVPTERSRNARLLNMLDTFNLTDWFVEYTNDTQDIISEIIEKLLENISYDSIDVLLEDKREQSLAFLKNSLQVDKGKELYLAERGECTGCGACYLSCPANAISMERDALGFVYPKRDENICIDCGKCKKICQYSPSRKDDKEILGLQSNSLKTRLGASSGGVFFETASYILKNGGAVVACRYTSQFEVKHDICTSLDELEPFCQSKYVQSNAYEVFPEVKRRIGEGQTVLFVGTPCQTASLISYFGWVPDKLYLIDLICGGVGAPGLWKKYLDYQCKRGTITSLTMRYKYTEYLRPEGFPAFSVKIDFSDKSEVYEGSEDLYLRSRLSFYRDACYSCRYKGCNRESDITIGDFVGMKDILRTEYDGYGTTLALVHTEKGKVLLENCSDSLVKIDIPDDKKTEIMSRNAMFGNCMSRKNQHYYMKAVYENSSIERIFYEDKLWDEFSAKEFVIRNFFNEIKRNDLLLKTERFIQYRLWIDDDPAVNGKIFIYGAGKLGRSLLKCIREVEGFIDGNPNLNTYFGIKVYHMDTDEIQSEFEIGTNITVIITPIWDFDVLQDKLKKSFPGINVVSVKDLVGNIWM